MCVMVKIEHYTNKQRIDNRWIDRDRQLRV